MDKIPFFTVYILNYNYSKYIEKSILSIINQQFKDFEFFVIDDGSTDDSLNIIEELQQKYSFEVVKQKNMGMLTSINTALKKANGKYLFRVDADDWIADNCLSLFADYLKDNEFTYLFSSYYLTDEFGEITGQEGLAEYEEKENHIPHGACMAVSVDRLKKIGGYNEDARFFDGNYIWENFHKENIGYINQPLFYYRRHNANMSLKYSG